MRNWYSTRKSNSKDGGVGGRGPGRSPLVPGATTRGKVHTLMFSGALQTNWRQSGVICVGPARANGTPRGVGLVTRKMGNSVSPVIELTENNGEYTLSSSSTFKNSVINFKLGQEFDEETPDGRKVKSIITQDGNKLHQIQKGDKTTTIDREFTDNEVKMVSESISFIDEES
ncbi:Fatty acid-binding protein [Blattella germanica]|nr:Fatty acid-binding protein [Blattella germanica]